MSTIKKTFQPIYDYLADNHPTTLEDAKLVSLMEARKGGFSGESNFVEVDGKKVARVCALTGAVFTHNNDDKNESYFYKNGSYCIPAEIIKAQARKAHDADLEQRKQNLEDQMLEGTITPQEWKKQVDALRAEEFEFTLSDEAKEWINTTYNGYPTKEAWLEAFNAGEVLPFSDYSEITEELRDKGIDAILSA